MSSKSPPSDSPGRIVARRRSPAGLLCVFALCLASLSYILYWNLTSNVISPTVQNIPLNAQEILTRCASLKMKPGPPSNFLERGTSDRFEEGTPATVIKNATIWTGDKNGTEIVYGDILLDKGIVKAVGHVPRTLMRDTITVDAGGAWVTPGLIDFHSHVGIYSLPALHATFNLNSHKGPVLPWLRTIDAFDTHDDSIELVMAGGVTSMQVLPGSANAIAGQAFMMKLRKTAERSPTSMVIEPPHEIDGSDASSLDPPRWRYLKQAAGENIDLYGNRMDTMWAYRQAYQQASRIKAAQDAYCANAESGLWHLLDAFPESFQYEALVDVLRGRVKVSQHVYETVDIDAIVRLSNEFQFHVDSIHHAAEAWLVPGVLERMWGGPPAIALFSDNYRYKRESYRGSVHAPRVLADHNFTVIMKTDHPALNGRYLLYEAQQAHHYGLPLELALASVTTAPAAAAGLAHRLGTLRTGMDADVVLWDSHPLRLGATPMAVWIDGVAQPLGTQTGVLVGQGKEAPEWREPPKVPDWKRERREAIDWDGLPPLKTEQVSSSVVFTNVSSVFVRGTEGVESLLDSRSGERARGIVVVEGGKIRCAGTGDACSSSLSTDARLIDLEGGVLAPAFISFGSNLGLQEISYEASTGDGFPYDPFAEDVPRFLRDPGGIVQAADALEFQTRNALIAHRAGVTAATSPPQAYFTKPTLVGLSATFRTGAPHALVDGAIIQRISALHYTVRRPDVLLAASETPSISTRIAALRRLLLADADDRGGETQQWFSKAAEGALPLIVDVGSADAMAALLQLKEEVEQKRGTRMRLVFSGAAEAPLLAKEIGKARVGVILTPPRPFPLTWDAKRILPGPPLSNDTALVTLLRNNVLVGIGTSDAAFAAHTRFDLAWATAESNGRVSPEQALGLASVNLERLLGIDQAVQDGDMVAWARGSPLETHSSVVGVASSARGLVDLL
ncbi:composite domain of metallo-dependent hydrolase [Gloeopeniophorella convolvens]|nr:composite domain of metallo-dependent hydrolase [Gloeopeniophorella convolvens]